MPTPPPQIKARIEALIDYAMQAKERKEENVPLALFKESVLVSIDLWEMYGICVVDREELIRLGTIKVMEMQHKVNQEAARADRNATIAWIAGAVALVVGFVVGAAAF